MRFVSDFGFLLLVCTFTSARADDILGYTEPYKIITVSADEPGILAGLRGEEGAPVKKNQILARLDVAVLSAELEIAKAKAQLQATRKQRLAELAQASRATADELDKAKTDLVVKEAQVRKTEAMIEARTMRSPVDGIVTKIKRDPSESVSIANPHVLTVVQIDKLTVNLFLPPAIARAESRRQCSTAIRERRAACSGGDRVHQPRHRLRERYRTREIRDHSAGRQHRAGARCTLAEERVADS